MIQSIFYPIHLSPKNLENYNSKLQKSIPLLFEYSKKSTPEFIKEFKTIIHEIAITYKHEPVLIENQLSIMLKEFSNESL